MSLRKWLKSKDFDLKVGIPGIFELKSKDKQKRKPEIVERIVEIPVTEADDDLEIDQDEGADEDDDEYDDQA